MTETVTFNYSLPGDDTVEVTAEVTFGRPGYGADMNGPGEPAEAPIIEITECVLKDVNDIHPDLPFSPDGLWLKRRGLFIKIEDDMETSAWDEYNNQ
ncbi:MAG: hypothetical protein HQ513_18470 [Rhodospirillales bacterium]|nr:hypothetical protein [Rhodospirillales bacterium]